MATYQQLQDDVLAYLNRRDVADRIPSWLAIVDTELAQTLRARCMVVTALQNIDSAYITLPPDFCTMESIRDYATGAPLVLKDEWSGSWTDPVDGYPYSVDTLPIPPGYPAYAYRLKGDCIEFLPHPYIPDPPDPAWVPQAVEMGWYAKPRPLVLPADTNTVLEAHYAIYLYGILSHAGVFDINPEMTATWDAKYQQAVTRANLWKQQSDYSGAPLTAELSGVF